MLSAAKHLSADRARPCAEFTLSEANGLRVTGCDCSNCQGQFVQIEPCLTFLNWISEHPPRPILNFHDQNRPLRRRRIHARSADVSADGPSMRSPGRYIGAAGMNPPPTDGWINSSIGMIAPSADDEV